VAALAAAGGHAGERDMALWAVEWVALPQAWILASGVAAKLRVVLDGLEVDTGRMRRNVALTRGGILAEAVMMRLAERIGHGAAHAAVGAAARASLEAGTPLVDALLAEPRVAAHLDPATLGALLEPERYLGLAPSAADAAAATHGP
jgi:3-carboxy-cis,cis-muconate cycloisomerase